MPPDTLSDVLRVIRLSGGVFLRLHLSPPFGFATKSAETLRQALAPESEQLLPFHLVNKGPVWFHIEGADSVQLETNDILVLPHGAGHGLSDTTDCELAAVPDFLSGAQGSAQTFTWPGAGHGEESIVLCGFFACRARLYSPLLDALPNVMVIRHDPERTPWLAATLQRTLDETLENRPGGSALVEQLTSLLFMEVVQRQLEKDPSGWLGALSDPMLGRVLQLIHQQPAQAWTVESLAKRAGSSGLRRCHRKDCRRHRLRFRSVIQPRIQTPRRSPACSVAKEQAHAFGTAPSVTFNPRCLARRTPNSHGKKIGGSRDLVGAWVFTLQLRDKSTVNFFQPPLHPSQLVDGRGM